MKTKKQTPTPKNAIVNNNVNVEENVVQRVAEMVYNELSKLGANMDNYVVIGTRIKTDAKITEMEAQNPEMAKAYKKAMDLKSALDHNGFDFGDDEYAMRITLKKVAKK